ncbi:Cytoplasmic tRNA 2-thiolation protein 2 [Vermiconidia calcicola]|uniref:Cytoplasmic tRNA 2-thiolation protein 2 n=1 Tax=Vermiconidia calcicola TaxID=1690605 RepID=A0ACC3N3B1_9PEZI|nr:Cytoplasmic tRNA 2-thiolation protein 2 [Vermiconidia calcicola]
MPGRRGAAPTDFSLCRRCQSNDPTITVRTEPLCDACFCKYVATKVVKRMETFRVRHSEPGYERTLLLPLSFGAGSTTLLHLLSEHLKGQVEKTRRTGFKLHLLHIADGSRSTASPTVEALLEKVKQRYPEHSYSISHLSDALALEDVRTLLGNDSKDDESHSLEGSDSDKFERLIASVGSATSRADVFQLLKLKLIVHFAKSKDCEAILWGDSTTKLAERTLAETAKGRGFALPWTVADGESPHGMQLYYPMRELLSKEIASFASIVDPPLDELILRNEARVAVSTRNTTIDDLMKQYFESVERDYPSIVANVVRTTGKLQAASLSEIEKQCELCEMPLDGQAPERSRLCYGCIRALPQAAG